MWCPFVCNHSVLAWCGVRLCVLPIAFMWCPFVCDPMWCPFSMAWPTLYLPLYHWCPFTVLLETANHSSTWDIFSSSVPSATFTRATMPAVSLLSLVYYDSKSIIKNKEYVIASL